MTATEAVTMLNHYMLIHGPDVQLALVDPVTGVRHDVALQPWGIGDEGVYLAVKPVPMARPVAR